MRVSRYFKYTNSHADLISFLCPEFRVEVHMFFLKNPDIPDDVIYEMIVHSVDKSRRVLQVFFEDDSQQTLYTVPFKAIAPIRSPMRGSQFSPGTNVEVRYRIDADSPWGWWPARILETIYDDDIETPHNGANMYKVAFPPHFDPNETEDIPYYLVRTESYTLLQ